MNFKIPHSFSFNLIGMQDWVNFVGLDFQVFSNSFWCSILIHLCIPYARLIIKKFLSCLLKKEKKNTNLKRKILAY